MKTGNLLNYIFISIAIIIWGFSLIWSDCLLDQNVPVFTLLFMRMVLAASIMMVIALISRKFQKIQKGDLKWFILLSFMEPFVYFIGETYGLKITGSPTLAAVVIALIPIFSLMAGRIFFREQLTALNRAGIFVSMGGIILFLILGGDIRSNAYYGIAVMMLAVIGSTGFSAICKKLTSKYNPIAIVTYQFVFAIPFFLVPFLIWGVPEWKPEFLGPDVMVPLVKLALFCSCIAFILYVNSVDKIGMTKSVIFVTMIPAVSAVAAVILGQDVISPLQFVGMALAMVGVVLSQYKKSKTVEKS